jgi:hypothetical protein
LLTLFQRYCILHNLPEDEDADSLLHPNPQTNNYYGLDLSKKFIPYYTLKNTS